MEDYFPLSTRLGELEIFTEAMAALFKVLVALAGLRRAPGAQGLLKSVNTMIWHGQAGRQPEVAEEIQTMYMTSDRSSFWPVPTTMNIIWD